MGASEKAYLDQLERMITSPTRAPYIRRGPTHRSRDSEAVEPVFDSGPMKPEEVEGPKFEGPVSPRSVSPRAASALATDDGKIRLGSDGIYEIEIEVPKSDLPPEDEERPVQRVRAAEARPTPPPRRKPMTPPAAEEVEQAFREAVSRVEATPQTQNLFPDGTLVRWNGGELGIYRQHLESKGYDLLYVVEDGGRLQPKGVCLTPYEPERVGLLSQGILQWMESTMRWDREALICHLDSPDAAKEWPVLSRPQPQAQVNGKNGAANHNGENGRWVRGRTFTISVGKHTWSGVYWGKDSIGTVVVHNTNHVWSLMHLNLKRYGSSVEYGDVLPEGMIEKIEAAVSAEAQ